MKTSIVMLTYNKLEYTKQCIDSIRKYTKKNSYELIVIDNNSDDGTKEWLELQKDIIKIYNNKNLGFPKGCNQGIEISTGDNILLLNNDTIVTESWLDNLINCLYSTPQIGAAGPVTNSCAYYQAIETNYNTIEEMQAFAKEFNKTDKSKYEERLKLIGFCMLIKKEVIEKIGLLDEIFTPGNYEDDDYSIRIRRAGYKLILCNDTFIHHYGGVSFNASEDFKALLKENEKKFQAKWGFTSQNNMKINKQVSLLMEGTADTKIKVLEFGCGCGASLLYLKNIYKNAEVYGVDINNNALNQANFLNKAVVEDIYNIDRICSGFDGIKFDYIFINDILMRNVDNKKIFDKIKKLLQNGGKLFVDVENPNYRNNTNIKKRSSDIITPEYIAEILSGTNYKNISGLKVKDEYDIKSYIICAEYNVNLVAEVKSLNDLLMEIENGINIEENMKKILQGLSEGALKINDVIDTVKLKINEKCELLNALGVKAYEGGLYDFVIPFLQAAFEVNEKHKDTLINLGLVLEAFGEYELAINYLQKIEEKDTEIEVLINDIKNKHIIPKEKIRQKLKFLLRRVENNIETEESRDEVYSLINTSKITVDDILNSVEKDMIKKSEVLNSIAVKFYEKGFYEEIIPLFQKAYDYNPDNFDTIYNLGFFLYQLGEKEMALNYFEKIQGQSNEVDNFIMELKNLL